MQEGRFNQGCDVTLLGGGEFSSEEAVFFAANLALGAILFYQGGDILRGRCYFVTPPHVAETMKFMAGVVENLSHLEKSFHLHIFIM